MSQTPSTPSSRTDPPTTLRVGFIGLGSISHNHADRVDTLGHDIVGGVDISPDARADFTDTYDAQGYESYDALAANHSLDAVIITTPNKFHEQYAVQALEDDIPVLVEKPLSNTVDSAERIAAAAADSNADCMVGFNNRFLPASDIITQRRDNGFFGDIRQINANFVRRRGIPGRGTWFTNKAISGGGALTDIGVHAIDLALYYLDFPDITEVTGTTLSEFGGRDDYNYLTMWGDDQTDATFDVEDSASAYIRCANDAVIDLDVAWATNRPTDNTFHITGTNGGATLDRFTGDLTLHDVQATGATHFIDSDIETQDRDTHLAEVGYFLHCIAHDTPIERNTVDEALTVQRVIDAIYRSADTGHAVTL